jgi:hypothetical protein
MLPYTYIAVLLLDIAALKSSDLDWALMYLINNANNNRRVQLHTQHTEHNALQET